MKIVIIAIGILWSVAAGAFPVVGWESRRAELLNATGAVWVFAYNLDTGQGPTYTIQPGQRMNVGLPDGSLNLRMWPTNGVSSGYGSGTAITITNDINVRVEFYEDTGGTGANHWPVFFNEVQSPSFWFWAGFWSSFALNVFGLIMRVVRQMGRTSPEL